MQIEVGPPINRRILHVSHRLLVDSLSQLGTKSPMDIMTNELQKINCDEKNPLIGLMKQRRAELNPFEAYKHHEVLAFTHWILRRQSVRSTGHNLSLTQEQVADYLQWLAEINNNIERHEFQEKMTGIITKLDTNTAEFVNKVTGLGTLRHAGYLGAMDVFFPMISIKPQGS